MDVQPKKGRAAPSWEIGNISEVRPHTKVCHNGLTIESTIKISGRCDLTLRPA